MKPPKLKFSRPLDEREAYEAEARGYLAFAYAELDGGGTVPLVFYDAVRLAQDLEEEAKWGHPFIADPGLVVLESVTLENMEIAVQMLNEEGYFSHFLASGGPAPS
ncbi:MAG: hypothetical protein H6740_08535 [Alphaproteobacteria bacterium]|nr:hypothetical protein [Alphaproteobacteria bacterium]